MTSPKIETGFLEESPGVRSITRLGFSACLFVALLIALYQVYTTGHMDVPGFIALAGVGGGLKVYQKTEETKQLQIKEAEKKQEP